MGFGLSARVVVFLLAVRVWGLVVRVGRYCRVKGWFGYASRFVVTGGRWCSVMVALILCIRVISGICVRRRVMAMFFWFRLLVMRRFRRVLGGR